jgi:hypothetical protein
MNRSTLALSLIASSLHAGVASAGVGKSLMAAGIGFSLLGMATFPTMLSHNQLEAAKRDPIRIEQKTGHLSLSGRYLSLETFQVVTNRPTVESLTALLEQIDGRGPTLVMPPDVQSGVWAIRTLLGEAKRRSGGGEIDPNRLAEIAADAMFADPALVFQDVETNQYKGWQHQLRVLCKSVFMESFLHEDVHLEVTHDWVLIFQDLMRDSQDTTDAEMQVGYRKLKRTFGLLEGRPTLQF